MSEKLEPIAGLAKVRFASDWELIAAMREEERQKALRLSSEAVKAARAKILADLKGSRDDR
jgi:hypothetical protein